MSPARRLVRIFGYAALAAGLATATGTGATAAAESPAERDRGGAAGVPVSVTLVTGDRVVLPSADATSGEVVRGKGRHVAFVVRVVHDHLYVIPTDAAGLLQSGALDGRLFDVTGLVDAGYDDARRDTLPLAVTSSATGARSVEVAKERAGAFWQKLAAKAKAAEGHAGSRGRAVEEVSLAGAAESKKGREEAMSQAAPDGAARDAHPHRAAAGSQGPTNR